MVKSGCPTGLSSCSDYTLDCCEGARAEEDLCTVLQNYCVGSGQADADFPSQVTTNANTQFSIPITFSGLPGNINVNITCTIPGRNEKCERLGQSVGNGVFNCVVPGLPVGNYRYNCDVNVL